MKKNIIFEDIIVSAYCRVSTDKDDQANSFESQIKYFTEYITKHENWTLGEVYFDEGISGTSIKRRDGFNRMIRDGMTGKFNLILTKEVSRFARNTVDTLTYTRKFKQRGIGVYFVSDNINTLDADGELRLTIMASLAQEESRKTSERVKWGQARKMEAGVVFGRDLLGYTVKNGALAINKEEADIVRLIFHKYVNENKGTWTISRELWANGIKPKYTSQWSNTTILKILRNEKYAGDLLQKKTYTPDYLTHAKKYNRGHEDKIYLSNHHEPIIDRDTWDRTQSELLRRSPSDEQKSKHSNRYWCSGKIVCSECGQRFVSKTKQLPRGKQYKAWRCCRAANHGTRKLDEFGSIIGCDSHSVNDNVLLSCVGYAIKYAQTNKKSIIKEIAEEIKELQSNLKPIDTSSLKTKLEKLHEKKKRAIDIHIEGLITREDLRRQTQSYDEEIDCISSQLAEAQNANNTKHSSADRMQAIMEEINNIMNFDTDNELLYREHLDKIVVRKNKSLTVFLKHLPYGINVVYKTVGRGDSFDVIIESTKLETNR